MPGRYFINLFLGNVGELSSQFLYAEEVGIEPATAYLVATGLGYHGFSETGYQRTDNHYRPAQRSALFQELRSLEIIQVDVLGLETVCPLSYLCRLHAQIAQQLYEVIDIENVGQVINFYGLRGEQRSTQYLQSLVLSALRYQLAVHTTAAFYNE